MAAPSGGWAFGGVPGTPNAALGAHLSIFQSPCTYGLLAALSECVQFHLTREPVANCWLTHDTAFSSILSAPYSLLANLPTDSMPISEYLLPMAGSLTALHDLHSRLLLCTYKWLHSIQTGLNSIFGRPHTHWEVHSWHCCSALDCS